jgi:hypothetical protein
MAPNSKSKSVLTEHKEYSKKFIKANQQLKQLSSELNQCKQELALHMESETRDYSKIVELKDKILYIKDQIRILKSDNDEIEYLTNTGSILFKYFDTYEGSNVEPINNPVSNSTSILSFFGKSNQPDILSDGGSNPINRGGLYEKYMELVDKNYIKTFPEEKDVCEFCGCTEKQLVSNEGLIYCKQCHNAERLIMEVEKPSYKEPPSEVTYYAYKRMNHYNEWINQIQGKEYTEIPNEVIDSILVELQKQKITNMAILTPKKVREILRKLKINKYYEHIPYIMYKLNGIPPPRLGQEVEEKLRQMFDAIQIPYLRHSPSTRKNFLSYSYVLHKLLQILDKPEFLRYFPLLKSREKLAVQEAVWQKICKDLGWPFIKSI